MVIIITIMDNDVHPYRLSLLTSYHGVPYISLVDAISVAFTIIIVRRLVSLSNLDVFVYNVELILLTLVAVQAWDYKLSYIDVVYIYSVDISLLNLEVNRLRIEHVIINHVDDGVVCIGLARHLVFAYWRPNRRMVDVPAVVYVEMSILSGV